MPRFNVPVLALEGQPTDDGRIFAQIDWRDPPLTLYAQLTNAPGHDDAPIVGQIVNLAKADGVVSAIIDLDDLSEAGRIAARAVARGDLKGISMDALNPVGEVTFVEDGNGNVVGARFARATIGAATLVGIPAWSQAHIDKDTADMDPMVASAAEVPPEWFQNPNLDGPTPLTVTDEGRLYGHAAQWGTCHIGYPGVCKTAPTSASGYRWFHLGMCAGQPTGVVTMGGDHPDLSLTASQARDTYSDTSTAVADVRAGEDAHGIWVAGAVRADVMADDEKLRALRASKLSGDWRPIDGRLELVHLLAVNTPGFPVARSLVAAGTQTALVAAGIVCDCGQEPARALSVDRRVDMLERLEAQRQAATLGDTEARELELLLASLT